MEEEIKKELDEIVESNGDVSAFLNASRSEVNSHQTLNVEQISTSDEDDPRKATDGTVYEKKNEPDDGTENNKENKKEETKKEKPKEKESEPAGMKMNERLAETLTTGILNFFEGAPITAITLFAYELTQEEQDSLKYLPHAKKNTHDLIFNLVKDLEIRKIWIILLLFLCVSEMIGAQIKAIVFLIKKKRREVELIAEAENWKKKFEQQVTENNIQQQPPIVVNQPEVPDPGAAAKPGEQPPATQLVITQLPKIKLDKINKSEIKRRSFKMNGKYYFSDADGNRYKNTSRNKETPSPVILALIEKGFDTKQIQEIIKQSK